MTFSQMQSKLSVNFGVRKVTFQAMRLTERLTEPKDRIRYVRQISRLSQERFAETLGTTRGAVGNWELGKGIKLENLERIAEKFGVSLDWLSRGTGSAPGEPVADVQPDQPPAVVAPAPHLPGRVETAPPHVGPAIPTSNVRPANVELPNMREMPLDLPVYGTTAGSHQDGSVQISTDPIDYVRRPPGLMGVKDAYSLFVEGDSMSPRHRHGDLICVRADRKARVGDDVVVVVQNGAHENHESFIAELLKLGTDEIVIGKLNPVAEIVLKRSKIRSIHRVLTLADLFGV